MANTEMNGILDNKTAKRIEKMKKKQGKKGKTVIGDEEEGGGKAAIFFITLIIVIIWLAIFAVLIKLDVGGFGSTVLYPVLKDVPYINKILPDVTANGDVIDVQYPYSTLEDAIDRIKELEIELGKAIEEADSNADTIIQLRSEINRLQEFENEQAKFQEIKTKFYEEVVFSDQSPDINEYKIYYESIDAANAAELYKQVVEQVAVNEELAEYANTYSAMKPKQAAAIMEKMTNDLDLVSKILGHMDTESRGNILGEMDPEIAAQITKLMEP